MKTKRVLPATVTAALAVTLALAACSDDGGGRPAPTLGEIWPHADGSTWTYEVVWCMERAGDAPLPSGLPSFAQLRAALDGPPPGGCADGDTLLYTFGLSGTTTTPGGLTAQAVVNAVDGYDRPDSAWGFALAGNQPTLLLGGTAFACRDGGCYRYGTLEPEPNWIYLQGDLRPGTEFGAVWPEGLLPARALRARVWSVADRVFDGVRHRDVVECLYLYDLGEDEYAGLPVRNHVGGRVWYAPGVGPVAWQEQGFFVGRTAYGSVTPIVTDHRGVLLESVLPDRD